VSVQRHAHWIDVIVDPTSTAAALDVTDPAPFVTVTV